MEGGKREGRRKARRKRMGEGAWLPHVASSVKSFCVFTSLMHLSFLIFSSYFYLVLQQLKRSEQTNSFRYR